MVPKENLNTPGTDAVDLYMAKAMKKYPEYPALCGRLEAILACMVDDILEAKDALENCQASLAHEKLTRALQRIL